LLLKVLLEGEKKQEKERNQFKYLLLTECEGMFALKASEFSQYRTKLKINYPGDFVQPLYLFSIV
jgi:hypothetical protein